MLEKHYKPADLESSIYEQWEASGAFRAGSKKKGGKAPAPYCIVIPPPNVTGSLHMGHALNNTLQDILIRFERMRGKDVLWQPGTDHAGIATQAVVERQLMERQEPDRRAMGREAFVERVWEWKAESGGTIIGQLKRLGASCDWSRERFTMGEDGSADDQMVQAVIKVFVDLYNTEIDGKRLIKKDKRLVNWDTKLLTAISDLEVESIETQGHLWYFRYPIAGAKFDPDDPKTFVVVATTRPETMLGDTAVAVHPDDKRYKKLLKAKAKIKLPLVGREMPLIADDYADPEQGSGAVKITPAHDFNDFEVGKRHELEMINIFDQHGALNENVPETYRGLDRFEARKRVVADLEALGLVEKIEPHTHALPYGDRSNSVIEPWLTDQWYVDAKTLAKEAIKAVEDGRTVFVPKNWEKTYFEWMRNIQPWCISRQLWWGHQIPVWYGPKDIGEPSGQIDIFDSQELFCAESEAEAIKLAEEHYERKLGYQVCINVENVGGDPISEVQASKGANPAEGSVHVSWYGGRVDEITIFRDPDVLDTWFSSALWPFSTLGWPDETPELKRYYPNAVLVTGFDIIFFWVARMMMMGLHVMKEIPFPTVYIHALVRDEKGQKMSKSKGNVMDPLDIIDGCTLNELIEKRVAALAKKEDRKRIERDTKKDYPNGIEGYGADALRFTLAAMAAQGRDVKLSMARIEGYRNFATKLWNAARFGEMNGCLPSKAFKPAKAKETINRWIAGEVQRTAAAVTEGIEQYRFNEAAGALYHFVWHTFCDWYLELAKPILSGADEKAKAETQAMFAWTLDQILIMLHPFKPFVTEALWQRLGEAAEGRETMLILADWPELARLEDADADAEMAWLIDLISEVRSVRSEMNVPPAARIPLVICGASKAVRARADEHRETLARLARLDSIAFDKAPPKGAVQIVMKDVILALPLAGVIDLQAEGERLKREIDRVSGEIEKLGQKLGDEKFTARAPEHVVEENRERLEQAAAAQKRLNDALKRLEAAG